MTGSPDRLAAIMNSIDDQSTYATAHPGAGLISERSHTAGEKIHCAAFGWVRDVLALYGHNTVRLRPSVPTASLIFRILSRAWRSCRKLSNCGGPLVMSSNVLLFILSLPVSVRGQPTTPSRWRQASNFSMLTCQSPSGPLT